MTKICQEEGCNKEIETWQTYCQEHYAQKMQGQAQPTQPQTNVPDAPAEPKAVEEAIVEEQIKMGEPQEEKVIDVQEEPKQTLPDKPVEREPLPKIDDLTKSIVSQVAFKGAIRLMSSMAFEEKTFDTLIGEVRTLTNEFYRIIVEGRK